ncbi:MAG: adenylate/guanylate cyclase domain-containing protein, partial [Actinomycetota bacterium]
LRSDSRAFVEDRTGFRESVEAAGSVTADELRRIDAAGTTASIQRVDGASVDAAVDADSELVRTVNYLGREVLSGADELGLEDLGWRIVSEIEVDELDEPAAELQRRFLIGIASAVVLLTFAAVAWANRTVRPIRLISDRLRLSGDDPIDGTLELPPRSPEEFVHLAEGFDRMQSALRVRRTAVASASAARLDVLRRLLPPAIARRVERGERQVLDVVPQASVVVLVVHGVGALVRPGASEDDRRVLSQLLDEIDTLAEHHGIERVKLAGDAYFGACGIGRPYLDHAPRVVAFARATRDAVAALDSPLEIAAGSASGEVSVGLSGSAKLVYDAWGETTAAAHRLAKTARPGELLVSAATRALLPADVEATERDEIDGVGVWHVGDDLGVTS